jgi:hypothetical protein
MILMRLDGVFELHRRSHDVLHNSVNTETDAVFFLVRLDVNVAGAALDRVGEDQIDELDDGSFVGGFFQGRQVHFRFFGGQLHLGFFAGQVLHDLFQLFSGFYGAVELADGLGDGRFGGDDRLDVEAGHELDVVHGEDVGGIGHRDG